MRQIPLTRGYVAIVDDADYDRVMAAGPWHARPRRTTVYAQRAIRRQGHARTTTQQLHTFLTGWSYVDHRNRDGLDNQRHNLRQATGTQNNANQRVHEDSTSGFKGVDYAKRLHRWRARIQASGQRLSLGHFDTAEAAARAYDAAARELFGEFARPNFPLEKAS